MNSVFGLTRCNMHIVTKTLDASNQVSPTSKLDYICGVTKNGEALDCTITNNVATVTEAGYTEGDTVDIVLFCFRSSEGGSMCNQSIVQADEDKWQAYLDAQ